MGIKLNEETTCCSCTGAGIALGFFSFGLFLAFVTALVLSVLLGSILALVILSLSIPIILIVLFLIWRMVSSCVGCNSSSSDCL